jgi:molybdopterin-guanine dinucleotide biosynthesis protein A
VSKVFQDITGVILAGGKATRFGKNKAYAVFQETPFIQRILRVMCSIFSDLLLVTNTPEVYSSLPIKIIVDNEPYQGPLGGIATALQASLHEKIFVVACDMPLLETEVIREIIEQGQHFDAAIPIHKAHREYLMALYSKVLLGKMNDFLKQGRFSLKEFCKNLPNISWIPIEAASAFNVNTPQDLAALEERYAL